MYSILYAAAFFTLSIQLTIPRAKRLATSHRRLEVESEDSAQVLRKVPVAVILLESLVFQMASRVVTDRLASPCEGQFFLEIYNYVRSCVIRLVSG